MELQRLTEREENGTVSISCELTEVIQRLAELEDKIEEGRIIELPCKVGDTVYRLLGKCDGHKCLYNGEFGQWRCSYKGQRRCYPFVDEIPFELSHLADLGVHIFLTREEAEARLKEFIGE